MMKIIKDPVYATLVWFTHDLRVHDNAVLQYAVDTGQPVLCLYCIDSSGYQKDRFGLRSMGKHRERFLLESVYALRQRLQSLGQPLVIAEGNPEDVISDLLSRYRFKHVVSSQQIGYNEIARWQRLEEKHPYHHFVARDTLTLFQQHQLPFSIDDLPTSFSKFRRLIESSTLIQTLREQKSPTISALPPAFPVTLKKEHVHTSSQHHLSSKQDFIGGEATAIEHLSQYFSGTAPQHYKQTRNALGCEKNDWFNSSKLSPWLAHGCVSPRYIINVLDQYERTFGANESTYWIVFELLWREYFQWYSRKYGAHLFYRSGIQAKVPLSTFYPQRFHQWCQGNTPWPLVNACMKQLNETGFLSNRGRQIVASCLVYELGVDWRCGAAYFEQQLVDYDVAANWGNWQYIAGVGADPRGGRRFNIEKQQQQYDPEEIYIQRWLGKDTVVAIDSVDAADWPLTS